MPTNFKSTFDADKINKLIQQRAEKAMKLALTDTIADVQIRLDRGKGVSGQGYTYSERYAQKKGRRSPVDWNDTGVLRRSIDFVIKKTNGLIGQIGIKNVNRGVTSNSEILNSLISKFPGMWGLSKQEISNFINSFIRNFK